MRNWTKTFKNEKDFTLRLVIPWLKSLGYQDVRYTGGTEEFGRDVIFSQNGLGKVKFWTGVQVKYGKISVKHIGKQDIQELISQIKTAFTTPLKINQGKAKVSLSQIFVITNEFVTSAAQKILKYGLKRINYKIFDVVDIENSFKQEKIKFIAVSVLIRTPSKIDSKVCSKFKLKVYENIPSSDFFETNKDVYFDYSREFSSISNLLTFFKEFKFEGTNWEFIKIFLEIPPIFNLHEIKEYCDTYFKDKELNIYEEGGSVNIEYKLLNTKSLNFNWLKDVNSMQILQKK